MPGKVVIDANLRTITRRGLFRNRFSSGLNAAANELADRCSGRDIKFSASDSLFGKYSRSLVLAGVTQIEIEKGTPAAEIKKALNILTGRGFSAVSRILPRNGFYPESIDPVLSWGSLRHDLVPVKYRGETYFSGWDMLMQGFVAFGVGACVLDLQPVELKFGSAIFGFFLYPLYQITSRLIRHTSRALRFLEDSRLLYPLSQGGTTDKLTRLNSICQRMSDDNLRGLTRKWDFAMLAWLEPRRESIVMGNQRVINSLRVAQTSGSAELLTILASNPVPIIRAAAAENSSIPEEVIGKLINEDPEQSVREAVRKNLKVVAMLELAAASTSQIALADLARKPFPCVRRAAARNPQTPAEAVAYVLSQLLKDPIEGVIRTESTNYAGPCDTPDFKIEEIRGIVGYGYVGKSLEISEDILKVHAVKRPTIIQRLQELNVELYEALNK